MKKKNLSTNTVIWIVYLAVLAIGFVASKYVFVKILTLDLPEWLKWLVVNMWR